MTDRAARVLVSMDLLEKALGVPEGLRVVAVTQEWEHQRRRELQLTVLVTDPEVAPEWVPEVEAGALAPVLEVTVVDDGSEGGRWEVHG